MTELPEPPEGMIGPTGACRLRVMAEIPEQIDVEFSSTGLQGGDAGHGGNATLEISWDGGSYIVNDEEIDNGGRIVFTAQGDWEIDGLVRSLITLGDMLKHVLDKMNSRLK